MVSYGQNIPVAWTTLNNALAVGAATPNVSGSSQDIGVNTIPQPVVVRSQITITNAAANDGYDLDIRVQFSPDNAAWPDAGRGQPLGNWYSAVLGDDLTRSEYIEFVPLDRYFRFQYDNNNVTDNLAVTHKIKLIKMQAG